MYKPIYAIVYIWYVYYANTDFNSVLILKTIACVFSTTEKQVCAVLHLSLHNVVDVRNYTTGEGTNKWLQQRIGIVCV